MDKKSITKRSTAELLKSKPTAPQVAKFVRTPIYVLLDNVRSRYNVGAIFRSCDAALVSKVFLGGITPRPPHKEIDKAALGATDVVPWQACPDVASTIAELKSQGVFILALELTHQSVSYSSMNYSFPICLVVGSEVNGISQDILDLCDAAVDIPMLGRAVSLNVATASGIALFELLRQYQANSPK